MVVSRSRYAGAILLGLVLAATSVTMAGNRHARSVAVIVTICSGSTVETLALDPRGEPVERGHHCPFCILIAAVLPEAGAMVPALPAFAARHSPVPDGSPRAARPELPPGARGPPRMA